MVKNYLFKYLFLILISALCAEINASYTTFYLKDIIEESDIIFVGKFTIIPKLRNNALFGEYYIAKMKIDSLLIGNLPSRLIDPNGYLEVRMSKRHFKTGKGIFFIKKSGIFKRFLWTWDYCKVRKINNNKYVKVNDRSIRFPLSIISNSLYYTENGKSNNFAPFETFLTTLFKLKNEKPLLRPKYRNCKVFAPKPYYLEQFFKDNNLKLNKADSIAIFNGVFLENVSRNIVHFILGQPKHIYLHDHNIEVHKYRYVDFYFRNDKLFRYVNRLK